MILRLLAAVLLINLVVELWPAQREWHFVAEADSQASILLIDTENNTVSCRLAEYSVTATPANGVLIKPDETGGATNDVRIFKRAVEHW